MVGGGLGGVERAADESMIWFGYSSVEGEQATEDYRQGRYAEAIRHYRAAIQKLNHR